MSYLARLRKAETPSIGAANAVKRSFGSKGSSDPGHFTDNAPPFGSKGSSDGGRFYIFIVENSQGRTWSK